MPLDLSGYSAPADDFKGLYKVAADIKKQNDDADEEKKKKALRMDLSNKYASGILNSKSYLTGDPTVDKYIGNELANQKASSAQSISKGATPTDLSATLAQPSSELGYLHSTAVGFNKELATWKQQHLANGAPKGIDLDKVEAEMKKRAFPVDANGNLDVTKYNPDFNSNLQSVLTGSDVYNNEGIRDYVSKESKNPTTQLLQNINYDNGSGKKVKGNVQMSYPESVYTPEVQNGAYTGKVVPHYQVATDGDQHLLHQFDGKDEAEPVRLYDSQKFESLSNPNKAYFMQETRKAVNAYNAQHPDKPLSLDSEHANQYARALAYNELNANSPKQSFIPKGDLNTLDNWKAKNAITNSQVNSRLSITEGGKDRRQRVAIANQNDPSKQYYKATPASETLLDSATTVPDQTSLLGNKAHVVIPYDKINADHIKALGGNVGASGSDILPDNFSNGQGFEVTTDPDGQQYINYNMGGFDKKKNPINVQKMRMSLKDFDLNYQKHFQNLRKGEAPVGTAPKRAVHSKAVLD